MSIDAVGVSSQLRSVQSLGRVGGPGQQPFQPTATEETGETQAVQRQEAAARSGGGQQGPQAAPVKPSGQAPGGGYTTPLRGQNLNILV